jgi:type I restriction enzyme S subunit
LAFAEIPLAINQGYIAIIDNKGFSKTFIYLWLRINMDYVKSHANGSTFQEISKTSFKALKIILPPKRLQIRFDETVNDNFKKIRSNLHQVRSLENLRNTLLPKLMSGEIRVASNG